MSVAVFLRCPGVALAQQLGHFLAALSCYNFLCIFLCEGTVNGILILMFEGHKAGSSCEENQYRLLYQKLRTFHPFHRIFSHYCVIIFYFFPFHDFYNSTQGGCYYDVY